MKHTISVNCQEFLLTLKDAAAYAPKNGTTTQTMDHVLLTVMPKTKKLSVLACDGFGLYERRISLFAPKGQPKPTLPGKEMRLGISLSSLALLVKFLPSRCTGLINLEVDDEIVTDGNYQVKITVPSGEQTTIFSKCELNTPDLTSIKNTATKGKKQHPVLQAIEIPVCEMLRAAKVFPSKDAFARIFTAKHTQDKTLALLECKTEDTDISVIFMLNNAASAA